MLVPLYGILEGDSMALVILAHDDWTMADIAEQMRKSGAARVSRIEPLAVFHGEQRQQPSATVRQLGFQALDLLQVRVDRTPASNAGNGRAAFARRERGPHV